MSSLRARLVAAVLVVAAVGLLLLAAITYAEQRSFLLDRVDEQARRRAARSRARWRSAASATTPSRTAAARGGGPPRGGGPGVGLPAGTYGELRDASGKVLGAIVFDYGQNVTAGPRSPPSSRSAGADRPGRDGDDASYRVVATRDRGDGDDVVVAVPLRDVDQTLNRLLLVEGLVIAGVLLLLAAVAWVLVRVGLLPLDRIGHTAGRIAGGDLSHRVEPAPTRAPRSAASGSRSTRCSTASSGRSPSARRARTGCASSSPTRRTSCARRWPRSAATPSCSGWARRASPPRSSRSMRRIEDEAARMGVLVEDLLTLARLDEVVDAPHGEVDLGDARRRRGRRRPRHRARPRDRGHAATARRSCSATPTSCARCSATCCATRSCTRPPGSPIEVARQRRGRRGPRSRCATTARACPPTTPTRCSSASGAPRAGASAARAAPASGLAIVAGIVDAHGGRVTAANADGGGAAFVVTLPAALVSAAARPSGLRRLSGIPSGSSRRWPKLGSWPLPPSPSPRSPRATAPGSCRPCRSTSSSPSTTRQAGLERSIRRLHRFLDDEFPFTLADRDRRQREHRRHAGDRPRARRELRGVAGPAPRAEGPRPRAARRLVGERGARRLLHGRRPLDRPARAAAARRAAALGPLRPRDRHAPGARRARRARPEARAHLAHLQPILRTALRARFSDAQCGFKAVRRDALPTCSPRSATTAGSSTPSCSCSPSAAGCASTRCRSTGSTTRTRASTSCAPRSTTCAASRG